MKRLRNSLQPAGEERFPYYVSANSTLAPRPRLDLICWNKKSEWQERKCGPINWPPAT